MPNFTKKAIKETFIQLLDEKPLNQITIKMIVEECGINRNTFYYHYQDLPSLIEEIVTEAADQIIAEYPAIDSIKTALLAVLNFASQNRRAIMHIYHSVNRDIFEHYLWVVCEHAVTEYGKTIFEGVEADPFDREILETFYKCECFGIAIGWMDSHMTDDIYAKVDRFCDLHQGLTEEMVRRSLLESGRDPIKTAPDRNRVPDR